MSTSSAFDSVFDTLREICAGRLSVGVWQPSLYPEESPDVVVIDATDGASGTLAAAEPFPGPVVAMVNLQDPPPELVANRHRVKGLADILDRPEDIFYGAKIVAAGGGFFSPRVAAFIRQELLRVSK